MNKRQSNKLNSYQSIKGVLEANQNIYASETIINQSVQSFFNIVTEIEDIATKTELDTTFRDCLSGDLGDPDCESTEYHKYPFLQLDHRRKQLYEQFGELYGKLQYLGFADHDQQRRMCDHPHGHCIHFPEHLPLPHFR